MNQSHQGVAMKSGPHKTIVRGALAVLVLLVPAINLAQASEVDIHCGKLLDVENQRLAARLQLRRMR
jgi:hypothetical protein